MFLGFISYLIIIIGFSPCKSSMDTVAVMVRVSLGNNEMKLSLQNTGFTTSFVFYLCIIKWLKKDNLSESFVKVSVI